MSILAIFGVLILIALAVWAVPQLLSAIGVPANVARIIYIALICLIVIWAVSTFFGVGPGLRVR